VSGSVKDARLFDHSDESGLTEYFYYDPETQGFAIETRQDVSAILDVNKEAEKHFTGKNFGDGWARVASIPMVIYMDLKRQGIADDPVRLRKWLNDRDNMAFRTRGGKV